MSRTKHHSDILGEQRWKLKELQKIAKSKGGKCLSLQYIRIEDKF